MDVKRLLWPTDFSENAAQALPVATSLAQKYQAEINIVLLGRGSHLAFRFELRPAVTDERPHICLLYTSDAADECPAV